MRIAKKKIWFFRYDTWQFSHTYLPATWYSFKRYYELNGTHSHEWEWIEPVIDYHGWMIDDIVKEAIDHKADVYMFSSYMWSWEMIKVIANAIREALSGAVIILGGPHQLTTYTQPMLWFKNHPYFTATCRTNEFGEFFITDMLDSISRNDLDWGQIRGSYYRNGIGPEGDKRDFVYPTGIIESNIDHARLVSKYAKENNKFISIMYETNRGCMYKCVYCEWGGGTNTKLVKKDMDSILSDVSYFRELDIHTVWITDANFGILKRDPDIANLFASQKDYMKFVGITGLAKTKAEKRSAVLEPLIQAGLVTLYQVSLQTIDDQTLENIERTDVTVEENTALAKYLIDKYDIDVIIELILGLPGMRVDTFYKETAIEYSLMNSIKPHTHHVPLYLLPDAPVSNPVYIEKFKIKMAPIALAESLDVMSDKDSKAVTLFESGNYKRENVLHIPISTYSYTVEDWKEMFFMNDMNLIITNLIMLTPFIDYLRYHERVPVELIFKKIFLTLSTIEEFYMPVYDGYLTPLVKGDYWNKPWRQFEVGPVTGQFSVFSSYTYLWISNIDKIYAGLKFNFKEYLTPAVEDCLLYCKNSTFNTSSDLVWNNKWRWDNWEESYNHSTHPVEEDITLITRRMDIDWSNGVKTLYRNISTFRENTNEKIKMKIHQSSRT